MTSTTHHVTRADQARNPYFYIPFDVPAGTTRIDVTRQACVGLEINANHIKGVRDGWVRGRATALHVGRSTQVWEIRITHEETGALVCISRITMAVIDLPAAQPQQA